MLDDSNYKDRFVKTLKELPTSDLPGSESDTVIKTNSVGDDLTRHLMNGTISLQSSADKDIFGTEGIDRTDLGGVAQRKRNEQISRRVHELLHEFANQASGNPTTVLVLKMMIDAGASGICVARVGEAEVFAENGCEDILIANQVIELNQIERLINLNKKYKVRVCVDSKKNIDDLDRAAQRKGIILEVVLEVDVGLGRNGVQPGEPSLNLANFLKKKENLNWKEYDK